MKPAEFLRRDAAPAASPAGERSPAPVSPRGRRTGSRTLTGLAISIALHGALAAALVVGGLAPMMMAPPPSPPMLVALENASPPVPPREVAQGPEQVERQASRSVPVALPTPRLTAAAPDPIPAPPPRPATPSDPGPAAPETTAPPARPAPPATRASSSAADTWEGRVLAALEKHRRYPKAAQARRQQGVAYIRFRVDRGGKVLWSRLERSSGFGELDRAAVEAPRRAQPLPPIPNDRPAEVELAAPVEFFISAG